MPTLWKGVDVQRLTKGELIAALDESQDLLSRQILTTDSVRAEQAERIQRLEAALTRARPVHYAGECGHCGIDELDPAECPTLRFIAEINAILSPESHA